jgi:proteic killer suppression protein
MLTLRKVVGVRRINQLSRANRWNIGLIKSFYMRGVEDIFNPLNLREARRTCPEQLWAVTRRKLDQLNAAVSVDSLRIPPGNRLEALHGDRAGQHSIRINDQFRVCFVWTTEGPERVEITDYHP